MSSNGETDVEVRPSDQQQINEFGRLNSRMHDLDDELNEKRAAYDQIDDAASELMLADDDENVR